MERKNKDYGLVFWAHAIVNLILYSSWFLLSWYWILLGELVLQIQSYLFGGCVLTVAEFKKEKNDTSCIGYYFEKWGIINKNTPKVKFFIRNISPWIVFAISLVWQVLLGFNPLLF